MHIYALLLPIVIQTTTEKMFICNEEINNFFNNSMWQCLFMMMYWFHSLLYMLVWVISPLTTSSIICYQLTSTQFLHSKICTTKIVEFERTHTWFTRRTSLFYYTFFFSIIWCLCVSCKDSEMYKFAKTPHSFRHTEVDAAGII